ncbi:hypothetical protein FHX42_002836 [Saccharopolyspora lacisalsi]|uniref:Uncharacterized protein n=1 Tax=Halosaccharopolyspora lacisalsi TaxID=1000566 RepID=A0A839E1A7_9PSEU|nr:hypothetical protein [Halosaccharopolyspora lacisalsi]MBA8825485.1 hypothetical protein [Halosaccharopolyspora lacisalsi]
MPDGPAIARALGFIVGGPSGAAGGKPSTLEQRRAPGGEARSIEGGYKTTHNQTRSHPAT